MSTFGTRCPTCFTAFNVNADLLRFNDGYGACGQCGQVFDMQAALFLLPPHNVTFLEHPVQADAKWPTLNAVVSILDLAVGNTDISADETTASSPASNSNASSKRTVVRLDPVNHIPARVTNMFFRITSQAEHAKQTSAAATHATIAIPDEPFNNVTFHVEKTAAATETTATPPAAQTPPAAVNYSANTANVLNELNDKPANSTWLTVACWVLLIGACLQTAGLFSREISDIVPATRPLYEQLNLPTSRG